MGDRWKVEVDHSICIGSGLCAGSSPEWFQLGASNKAEPRHAEVDAEEAVLNAAETCPVEAIALRRADSGELVFPPDD
ncbi:ferredoxin [Wenjunlia vitaminophila]|uniref:Ferredoxin n=1 Tax=Wenjunlia vitaminophila TaxID=76728 RepID=A0A0T6LKW1_WENVI|nr:ferredoxin [Wenjunlia vitaminophila]KRV46596.1 ferredoxin [Wenjunlia vitaminophila]